MARVRIIATPPGQAPRWVREKWIGVELPIEGDPVEGVEVGVLGGRPENVGGYHVEARVAINILERSNPEAARWWRKNIRLSGHFVFRKDVCELLE